MAARNLENELEKIEHRVGFNFKKRNLLKQAFTHESYVNEAKSESIESYQRLEFLGDAVIGLAIGEFYYQSTEESEGGLTNSRKARVNRASLAAAATKYGLGDGMYLGHGEEPKGRTNRKILADCFEALIGAAFLDSDYKAAAALVVNLLVRDGHEPG